MEEALWRVARETPSSNFRRFALIVTEAARSGRGFPRCLTWRRGASPLWWSSGGFSAQALRGSFLRSSSRPRGAGRRLGLHASAVTRPAHGLGPDATRRQAGGSGAGDVLRVLYISGFVSAVVGGLIVGRVVYGSPRAACRHGGGNTGGGAMGSAVDEVLKILNH